jgi:glycosyltransferase involved in cell wall biosynthesis
MKRGAGVITPNEFLRDAYAKRHTIEPILIRNPSLAMGDEDLSVHSWPAISNEIRIVYTGAVYHAHHDAFRNLVTAIALSEDATLQLHIHTAQTHEQLAKEGIEGPVRMGEHLKPSEVRIVQQQADILFLPLSFESPIQEVVRTSAPGKMGEYLASGRPVLVHAPADSYVSWYFRLHACGVVVDENSPHALLAGIRSIVEDTTLRKRIIGNAREAADRDFSLPAARAAYWRLFEIS